MAKDSLIAALKRKQCKANCLAWLDKKYDVPFEVLEAKEDRCLLLADNDFDVPEHFREPVAQCAAELTPIQNTRTFWLDFDYFNPFFGVWYYRKPWQSLCHFWRELVPNKLFGTKTDPFKIMHGLQKRGYDVDDVREVT